MTKHRGIVAVLLHVAACCGCGSKDCDGDSLAASNHIESARTAALACQVDSDCVQVKTSTRCGGGCPSVVNKAGLDSVNAAVAYADQEWCGDRSECPYATPGCRAMTPTCAQGKCASVPK